jgi:hypothetical protein
MSEYTGQDTGTLRVTIREAAARLGVTEAAIRKRIQRGSLGKELGSDGRVYVYLDLSRDMSHYESQVHRDPLVEELVEELRDRLAFLEQALERRSVEAERYQQIVAGLTQTNTSSPPGYASWRRRRSDLQTPLGERPGELLGRRHPRPRQTLRRAQSPGPGREGYSADESRDPTTRLVGLADRRPTAR